MQAARVIAPVLAAALLATGCGGGGGGKSEREKIEDSVTAYYKAFGTGDSAGACGYLAKDTRKELEKASGGKDCAKVLDEALKRPDYARIAKKLSAVTVKNVKIVGTSATAMTEVPGADPAGNGKAVSTTVPLKKEGDTWKIASSIGEG